MNVVVVVFIVVVVVCTSFDGLSQNKDSKMLWLLFVN